MTSYAGLDVSERATHVCVIDVAGKVLFGACAGPNRVRCMRC